MNIEKHSEEFDVVISTAVELPISELILTNDDKSKFTHDDK